MPYGLSNALDCPYMISLVTESIPSRTSTGRRSMSPRGGAFFVVSGAIPSRAVAWVKEALPLLAPLDQAAPMRWIAPGTRLVPKLGQKVSTIQTIVGNRTSSRSRGR